MRTFAAPRVAAALLAALALQAAGCGVADPAKPAPTAMQKLPDPPVVSGGKTKSQNPTSKAS